MRSNLIIWRCAVDCTCVPQQVLQSTLSIVTTLTAVTTWIVDRHVSLAL
jgi:hypothetical protein